MPTRLAITSTKNPLVARFRAAAQDEIEGELVVDGVRLVWDAVRAGLPIRAAAVAPRLLELKSGHDLRSRLEAAADEFAECTEPVLAKMSSLETPQGVIAIVARPEWSLAELATGTAALVVVAAGVRDPGNLGAILRTAEAAGATGFVALRGSADPFRDKAVRGSAGSVLRLPTVRGVAADELVAFTAQHGMQMVVADTAAERAWTDVDWTGPTVLVIGAEGAGVPPALRDAAAVRARIPLREPVDSLNAAVAAGVLLFEARRQRDLRA